MSVGHVAKDYVGRSTEGEYRYSHSCRGKAHYYRWDPLQTITGPRSNDENESDEEDDAEKKEYSKWDRRDESEWVGDL